MGSSGVSQSLVLVGMRLKSVAQSRAERSIVDRAVEPEAGDRRLFRTSASAATCSFAD